MILSRQLAQIIGPTLCVMTLSELINLSIWETNIPSVTFLNGVLLFVSGISIVRVHNNWKWEWTIFITVIGWLTLFLGLSRMLFPSAKQASEFISTYLLLVMLLIIGLFLTFKGYYPSKNGSDIS